MIEMIKEFTDQYHVLTRMFYNNTYKAHPITVQALDDDCGEIIETMICTNRLSADKQYDKYVFGAEKETVSIPVLIN